MSALPDPGFWAGRRVFLTGHTGFKGSWLTLWLEHLGATVTGYALAPDTRPSLYDDVHRQPGHRHHIADIRDAARLAEAVAQAQPEVVLHLAAQPLVRRSYREPVQTYSTNVMGTVHLLEAVRATPGVRAVVVVTSDKAYENTGQPGGYVETDRLGGYDPYSNSKACTELVAQAYRSSYFEPGAHARHGVALATVRAGNVIGGGDWAEDRLVPDLMRSFAAGQPAVIRYPGAVRPWQHVLEPLGGYLVLAQRLAQDGAAWGEAWNFGPADSDARPVSWIADRLASLWGAGASWHTGPGEQPHEAAYLRLDCAKARERLGWTPRWSLDQALQAIAAWHHGYSRGEDARQLCLAQVRAFTAAPGTAQ